MSELFDVLAVHVDSRKVRVLDTNKTESNADAIVNMAVCRRGIEEEFFVSCEAGMYRDGDRWEAK